MISGSCDGSRHLASGIAQIVGRLHGGQPQLGLLENLPSRFDIRPFKTNDQWNIEAHLFSSSHDGVGDSITLHDAAEDVHEHSLDLLLPENDSKRLGDSFLGGIAPDIEEIRRDHHH